MKCTVRRININLTEKEENNLALIKEEYERRSGKKQTEADIIRDAINEYAVGIKLRSGWTMNFSKNGN